MGVGALVVVSSVVVSDVVSEAVSEDSVVSEVSSVVVASVVVSVVVSFACVETEGRLVAAGCALHAAMPKVIASINIMLTVVLNFFISYSVFLSVVISKTKPARNIPAGYNYTPACLETFSHY